MMKYSLLDKTLLYIYLHSIVVLAHNKIIVYNHDDSINIVLQATPSLVPRPHPLTTFLAGWRARAGHKTKPHPSQRGRVLSRCNH